MNQVLDLEKALGKLSSTGQFTEEVRVSRLVPINKPRKANEEVYELRGATLILGQLDEKGNFVPKEGSTVGLFSKYVSGKDVPRIYNLPGRFVEK